jgi:ABC-type spermidine/putrescine transport system permease subunit II
MHRDRNPGLATTAIAFFVFLYAPIAILILFSFNDSKRNFVWRGFTLKWYPTLFANDALIQALVVSLEVALIAVTISTVLGTLLGLGIARLRSSAAGGASDTLLLLPMVTPEIVMGISLLLFFAQAFGAHGSIWQISIAHITFSLSYVAIIVRAARDLGASPVGAFWHVTLPLVAPAVAAGALIAFALSIDDLIVTTFNAGVGSSTLPLYIYSRIRFGVTPEINAISTIIVAITAVAMLVAWRAGAFGGGRRRSGILG